VAEGRERASMTGIAEVGRAFRQTPFAIAAFAGMTG